MLLKWGYKFVVVIILMSFVACDKDDSGPNDPPATEIPNKLYDVSAASIKSINYFPDVTPLVKYDVSVYKLDYKTTFKGSQITVSGVVVLPIDAPNPSIVVDCHGTLQNSNDAPTKTSSNKPFRFTQIASTGYIVFAPDYVGFGTSINEFHPWLMAEPGAQVIVDMINSGKILLGDYDVSYTNKIFLTGYSEGSNFVLSAQKKIESNPGLGINLVASAPVSGAYDMEMTFTRRIEGNKADEAIGDAYLILAFKNYYNWQNPLIDFFKEPYASEFDNILNIPGSFEDNIFGTPNQVLTDFVNGTLSPESLLTDAFRNDLNSEQRMKFDVKLIENNVHNWKPITPTTLYYGKSDTTTYFENSLNAYDSFISNGASPSSIKLVGFEGKDHTNTDGPAMRAVLDWFSTL